MKILHLASVYVPAHRYGGPIASVHNLNKWLVKKGVDVTVYTTDMDGKNTLDVPKNEEVVVDGVRVWYFPTSFPRAWEYSRAMHQKLRETAGQFDVIHTDSVFRATSTLAGYYARKYGIPYIISPRGSLMKQAMGGRRTLLKNLYIALVEGRNIARAEALHTTIEREYEEYKEQGFPNPRQVRVIPNGINEEIEKEEGEEEEIVRKNLGIAGKGEKDIVLFLGRLNWIKGIDTLIPAFKKVREENKNVVLVLAGSDEDGYGTEIRKMIAENGLGGSVVFAGLVTGKNKIGLLRAAKTLVLPSYMESFGMSAVEAMYLKIPVVLTSGVGIAPEVKKANAGIVVEKNEDALARGIREALKKEAEEMGVRGRELVREKFTGEKIAEEFIRLYQDCMEEKKKVSVTAVILTKNEEKNLGACLKSIKDVADEIIVVDSFSTDTTREIAKMYGVRFYEHEFENQADQFNWALGNIEMRGDWILRLDADEYLTPEIAREIRETLPKTPEDIVGYYMKRRGYFLGRWIRHGGYYPTWILRLFRKGKAWYEEREVDEHVVLQGGRAGRLKHDFVDENKNGLEAWIAKHNSYSSREARERLREKKTGRVEARLGGERIEKRRWVKERIYGNLPLFIRPGLYFFYRYVVRLGILDGKEGFLFHVLQGWWYQLMIDAKIHELKKHERKGKNTSHSRRG